MTSFPRAPFALLGLVLAAGTVEAQFVDAPPTAPKGLVARAYGPTSGGIAWQRASDDRGVVGYEVTRDGVVLGTFDPLSYIDRSFAPDTLYRFGVTAVDTAGQRSGTAFYAIEGGDAAVRLADADLRYEYVIGFPAANDLTGGCRVTSPRTAGRELAVRAVEPLLFEPSETEPYPTDGEIFPRPLLFNRGTLRIEDANGDVLTLVADDGDVLTADVEIVTSAGTVRLVEPWATWRDALEFPFVN